MYEHIPAYARFQWLNSPILVKTLRPFFRYAGTGRRGYDKVTLVRWLMYKQVMGCSYRDLESVSGIDHTTFIKFRKRLAKKGMLAHLFERLVSRTVRKRKKLDLILDSSFVETYSTHDEEGSGYSGYKEANGYKLHEIIDYSTRLPVLQTVSSRNVADIIGGRMLLGRAPPNLPVRTFAADKGYDSESFVFAIRDKWQSKVAIPQRHHAHDGNALNRRMRGAGRTHDPLVYKRRTEIERYFSRKKGVFNLGEERTRHLENFRTNCFLTSCMEILEWLSKNQAAAA